MDLSSSLIIVGSLDSSRNLQAIHVKSFINRLHLVFHVCVETFDVTFFYVYGIYGVRTKQALQKDMFTYAQQRRKQRRNRNYVHKRTNFTVSQ